ncbi:unnamed protein product [Eruca vesicaria subsp. sativa]|uniref:Uncharacterized protein n=1 Tax=Eruca vesicaria subsp. sativa TaxID=29727 RepID=A0ABC8M1B9_ERUVS|nr:unnamed protein product [Eruca vesicaria subsp. sativa]
MSILAVRLVAASFAAAAEFSIKYYLQLISPASPTTYLKLSSSLHLPETLTISSFSPSQALPISSSLHLELLSISSSLHLELLSISSSLHLELLSISSSLHLELLSISSFSPSQALPSFVRLSLSGLVGFLFLFKARPSEAQILSSSLWRLISSSLLRKTTLSSLSLRLSEALTLLQRRGLRYQALLSQAHTLKFTHSSSDPIKLRSLKFLTS